MKLQTYKYVTLKSQVTVEVRRGSIPANRRVKRKTYNGCHCDVQLTPEFFDAKLIICITFPEKSGDVSAQPIQNLVLDIDAPRILKAGQSPELAY
jgi:hypothetical protein